jgi:hypothetical protein
MQASTNATSQSTSQAYHNDRPTVLTDHLRSDDGKHQKHTEAPSPWT